MRKEHDGFTWFDSDEYGGRTLASESGTWKRHRYHRSSYASRGRAHRHPTMGRVLDITELRAEIGQLGTAIERVLDMQPQLAQGLGETALGAQIV